VRKQNELNLRERGARSGGFTHHVASRTQEQFQRGTQ
jgi:hypothetical protein